MSKELREFVDKVDKLNVLLGKLRESETKKLQMLEKAKELSDELNVLVKNIPEDEIKVFNEEIKRSLPTD